MEIKLLDTGWYSRDRTGTQATVANRAGYDGSSSVTTFTLKTRSVTLTRASNQDDNPVPSSTTATEVNKVTSENNKYTLKCLLKKDDTTSGFQYSQLYQLARMDKTSGVKLLYPSDTTDDIKELIELMGEANTSGVFQGSGKELSASTPYIVGRITSLSINGGENQEYFDITITFIEE